MDHKRQLFPLVLLLVALLLVFTAKVLFDQVTSWPARIFDSASDQAYTEVRKIRDAFVDLFAVQPKISINEKVVDDQAKTALQLAVLSRDIAVTRDAAQTWLGSTKTIRLHATYRVKAGFDLAQKLEVDVVDHEANIKVPKAKILSVEPLSIAVEELRDGLWNKIQPQDVDRELTRMQELARAKASSLPDDAEQSFQRLLSQKLGDLNVHIQIRPDVGVPTAK
ncbi:MAG: DUF4230 domain-containing protein [Verrucomicrobia bacterium]|nr:DUF4230 domain-containing protein [Verrucomicrobiota bacterium]